jgi:beta-N-acetylglucosaminidase
MKRVLVSIIAVFLFLVQAPVSYAADDIDGHYFENDMRVLIAKGILGGYAPGVYKPDKTVTRAEFAAFIVRSLEMQPVQSSEMSVASLATPLFKDVTPDQWYYASVTTAANSGLVGGYPDGTFQPNKEISRQEMAAMIIRAINTKGVFSQPATLNFIDSDTINPIFKDAVQRLIFLGVMSGNADNTFGPLTKTTRGQTSAVLNRMMAVVNPPQNLEYKVAIFNSEGNPIIIREYDSFDKAKASVVDNQVVLQGNNIVYMRSGLAVTNAFTIIHAKADLSDSGRTYVSTGTEFKYYDATEKSVKILLGDNEGYVDPSKVNLVPSNMVEGRSYYKRVGNELFHTVYNPIKKEYYSDTLIGKAPAFMVEGQKYYSWNGYSFTTSSGTKAGDSYPYFHFLPLHVKTNYTAEDIDRYLTEQYPSSYKAKYPTSPLAGTGKDFKEMEAKYGINALYLMAHAIHESAWGTSPIAQDKKNLYGMKAYDSDAYNSAAKYNSFRESIEDAAKYISQAYHAPKGTYYNGAVLGNKSVGMNVKYASDPYWGEKIAGHMYRADKFLGFKDINKQKLAANTIAPLNIRSGYGTSNPVIYELKISGIPFVYTQKAVSGGANWYQIITDDINNRTGYVYGDGSLGQYVKELPIAQ